MTAAKSTSSAVAALALAIACLALGAAIGLMSVRLLMGESSTGWDAIADALGGVIIGSLLGLVAGGYLARDLSVTARWWSAAMAIMLAGGTLWSLALTAS
jgi:hypothetical protein